MKLLAAAGALSPAFLLSSAFLVLPGTSVYAQENPRPVLTADQCQPLTKDNLELCCVAQNRARLLSEEEIRSCPPVTTGLVERVVKILESDGSTDEGPNQETAAKASPAAAAVDAQTTGSVAAGAASTPASTATSGSASGAAAGQASSAGDQGADSADAAGGSSGKNNNGLGNGSEPGDTPADSVSDVKGVDPSNPGKGNGGSNSGGNGKGHNK